MREYAGGIIAIDSGQMRPEMAACYLLEAGDRAVVIETGNRASARRILQALERRGWRPEDVSHVIVTHVHLDHAGGAGALLETLPEAVLVVHPQGLRHMIDPSRLEASARVVFGDAFDTLYGSPVPVPESRTRVMEDGDTLQLPDRELIFINTPGHARHHFCVWDEVSRGWFSGDTFGLSYRRLDTDRGEFVFPITTPIQFDPPALIQSIRRLMERDPEYMYLTHYGRVGDTERLAGDMIESVEFLARLGERHRSSANRTRDIETDMIAWLTARCRDHGVQFPQPELEAFLRPDVELNTQGIEYWLDHRAAGNRPGG